MASLVSAALTASVAHPPLRVEPPSSAAFHAATKALAESGKTPLGATPSSSLPKRTARLSEETRDEDALVQSLYDAAREGQKATLLSLKDQFYTCNKSGENVLTHAIKEEEAIAVRNLLALGFDPNCLNAHAEPPLVLAAEVGNVAMTSLLLAHGADVNATDPRGRTALHMTADNAVEAVAAELIKKGALVNIATKDVKRTPLHIAASKGHTGIVRMILEEIRRQTPRAHGSSANYVRERFALINPQDGYWDTPLHLAVASRHWPVFDLLWRCGASTEIANRCGHLPIHIAAIHGRMSFVEVLMNTKVKDSVDHFGNTLLHLAATHGHCPLVRFFIEKGLNTHQTNFLGLTPLHSAVREGQEDTAILLLDDTSRSFADKTGKTPLHTAALEGYTQLVVRLLNEEDKDRPDDSSATPLHHAVSHCHLETARALVDAGADKGKIHRTTGKIALHFAAFRGHKELTELVLDEDNKDVQDNEGNTPLHVAAYFGKLEIVKMLLHMGANPFLKNKVKLTPMQAAEAGGHLEVASLFRSLEEKTKESKPT